MADVEKGYCIIGIYWRGSDKWSPLACNGRIVVFDTPNVAKNYLQGIGRMVRGDNYFESYSADEETVFYTPYDPLGANRAVIRKNYPIYDQPPNSIVPSETKSMAWKYNIHWTAIANASLGQMKGRSDGTVANMAAGEEVW